MRAVGRRPHRGPPGEVPVRPGGVLPYPVPQPAHQVRQAPFATTIPAHRLVPSHRAALFRAAGGQDADRDAHPRHAAERVVLQLAVHAAAVTPQSAVAWTATGLCWMRTV